MIKPNSQGILIKLGTCCTWWKDEPYWFSRSHFSHGQNKRLCEDITLCMAFAQTALNEQYIPSFSSFQASFLLCISLACEFLWFCCTQQDSRDRFSQRYPSKAKSTDKPYKSISSFHSLFISIMLFSCCEFFYVFICEMLLVDYERCDKLLLWYKLIINWYFLKARYCSFSRTV